MALLGLFLAVMGFALNLAVLRGPASKVLTPAEILRTPPWLISMGLVAAGVLLIFLAGR